MKWGMVIDLKRCIGCYGCQLACKAEHGTPPGVYFARVLKQEEGQYPMVRQLALPVLCNHCEDPPCVEACPTGDRKSTRLNSSHIQKSRMPSSA